MSLREDERQYTSTSKERAFIEVGADQKRYPSAGTT